MKNNRTFLEKLLDGTEVEWKPLGDVCNFQNGFAFKSSLFKDNGAPIVRITNIDGKEVNLSDVKYFLLDDYNTDMTPYKVHKGDILIAMSGATTGKIGFYNYEHPSYLNQRVGKFLPNTNILNNRYLYHYLLSKVEDIYIISGGGAQPNLSSNRLMSEVLIPIPPLSVQTEIVKILDALTALTSELILRQKQYEYYREKLLSHNDSENSSQPFISYDILNKCIVPVPPIEEQQRIVSILDKFETLTNSITEGLPLAIEQSQKRYEYYRELLLNFS